VRLTPSASPQLTRQADCWHATRLESHPADVAAQRGVLVPEYQHLGILPPVGAEHQDSTPSTRHVSM